MKPLLVLFVVFSISLIIIRLVTKNHELFLSARIGMGAMLFFTAIGHFAYSKGMTMMIPSLIPLKTEIIFLTGILEILLGIGILIPITKVYSGWLLIIFLIILLPANIYASIKHVDYLKGTYEGNDISYLWFRIPLQLFFIAWVYISSIKN